MTSVDTTEIETERQARLAAATRELTGERFASFVARTDRSIRRWARQALKFRDQGNDRGADFLDGLGAHMRDSLTFMMAMWDAPVACSCGRPATETIDTEKFGAVPYCGID